MKTLQLIIKTILPLIIPVALPTFIVNLSSFGNKLESQDGLYPSLKWVYDNRLWLVPLCAIIGATAPIIKATKADSRVKGNVTKKLLKTLLTDIFNDEAQNTRITIFRDASWIKIFWIWVKESFWHPILLFSGKSKHRFPNPFNKYIIATERVGTENPNSQTYFLFVKKTRKECEGIASVVKQINQDLKVDNLPDINNINLDEFDELDDETKTKVNEYIQATCLPSMDCLKRLHIKARHFYATILKDEMLESKAVLIVDSISEETPFDEDTINKVSGYIKVFSTTF